MFVCGHGRGHGHGHGHGFDILLAVRCADWGTAAANLGNILILCKPSSPGLSVCATVPVLHPGVFVVLYVANGDLGGVCGAASC